ncbi:MAG: hypothetical protein A3F09_06175 [Chlamydiae bacterium RIFCSPHIGHO2_12_FULL_49_11]|nr:MAG: hypothetical protein A3F09_06175 [Chlamydiae bacterium RIFCSPHIGHO2_12_FULL_49_11]
MNHIVNAGQVLLCFAASAEDVAESALPQIIEQQEHEAVHQWFLQKTFELLRSKEASSSSEDTI